MQGDSQALKNSGWISRKPPIETELTPKGAISMKARGRTRWQMFLRLNLGDELMIGMKTQVQGLV
jgi:hypothetical protein